MQSIAGNSNGADRPRAMNPVSPQAQAKVPAFRFPEPAVLTLRRDCTLHVLMLDAAGRPAPGLRLQARRIPGSAPVDPQHGVATWWLAETVLPLLGERRTAYDIQVGAIPAVVRMQLRGILLDATAHAALIAALKAERTRLPGM